MDYICLVAVRQSIFFLWRPLLKDPKDDMVAEVAVAAGCDALITYNKRDFKPLSNFGITVMEPAGLLRQVGEIK